ncbi:MAG: hypothetical protein ACI4C5_08820 [Lachnospiraceae bacterium]
MLDTFYPKKIFEQKQTMFDEKEILEKCLKAQIAGFISKIVICIISGILAILNGYIYLMISFVFLLITIYLLEYTMSYFYHGLFIRKKYIQEGYGSIYLARQLIRYSNENHVIYDKFEKKVLEGVPDKMDCFCMETIKHMYMIKCINTEFKYPNMIKDLVEKKYFLCSLKEYKNMEIGEGKFNLMKAYLCYAVISKDSSAKNIISYYLEGLAKEEELNSLLKFDTVEWYLQILKEEKIIEDNNIFFKNTVLRRDKFLEKYDNYNKIYNYIENRMNSKR